MDDLQEFVWAAFCTDGSPRPFINPNSIRGSRREAQEYIGKAWARPGETPMQAWKRAYRNGWRAVRVVVDLAAWEARRYG